MCAALYTVMIVTVKGLAKRERTERRQCPVENGWGKNLWSIESLSSVTQTRCQLTAITQQSFHHSPPHDVAERWGCREKIHTSEWKDIPIQVIPLLWKLLELKGNYEEHHHLCCQHLALGHFPGHKQ